MIDEQDLKKRLRGAKAVTVLTGAGISAESGIPTFRGAGGLWRNFRPEELATPEAFERDPQLVWEWYDWRRCVVANAQPNPGHEALARLTPASLITQNVDDLHERAGSTGVSHLHGSIWRVRCTRCGEEAEDRRVPLPEKPPRCSGCNGMLRPAIVWFGEGLPQDVWDNAEKAARNADLLLVVGTSAVVYPAASLVPVAARAGAFIVEINPGETPVTRSVHVSLRSAAGVVLPRLIE
ncbi:MAG TPA: NAD-dependent deacylase [Bryobacteraceae bacterium]|nr:NAD-dependent deacylase [Bryobacteraceae bacterium]